MKKLPLLLTAAMTVGSAHAVVYVHANGRASDDGGSTSYDYSASSNTTVFGDETRSTPDMVAEFGSSSSLGTLKAYAHAITSFNTLMIYPRAYGQAEFEDLVTVGGTGNVTLHFSMPTAGTFTAGSRDALGQANFRITDAGTNNDLLNLVYRELMTNGVPIVTDNFTSADLVVAARTQLRLTGNLLASVGVRRDNPGATESFRRTTLWIKT